MSRSLFKGPFLDRRINIKSLKFNNINKPFKLINKNLTILPEHTNQTFLIYNGLKWVLLNVKDEMINYKFGDFITTRRQFQYKKKKK